MAAAPDLTHRVAQLSESKRELLKARLRASSAPAVPPPPAVSAQKRDKAPLSSGQQRMWFAAQLLPDSPVYNTSVVLELRGALAVPALRDALTDIVARHEILRTRYVTEGASPIQIVGEPGPVPVAETDLTREPPARQEEILKRILAEELRRPFALSRDLMLRAALIRVRPDAHVLALVVHHIASDLRSWRILFQELSACYAARAAGRAPTLAPLPFQYSDYAVWQQGWLEGPAVRSQIAYWKQKLAGTPGVIDLPSDRPRPATLSFRGAVARRALAPELVERLQAVCRTEGCTLFMALLAAFKVQLFRLTGQPDLVIGIPTAGRNQPHTQDLIGLFINTLPLRSELAPDMPFRALLRQVKDTTVDALTHQDVPFDKLVEEVHPPRDSSYSPLVQVMFTLQDATEQGAQFPGLTVRSREGDVGISRFDLMLLTEQTDDGIRATLEYNTDLFDPPTAARMLEQFQTVLQAVAADPDQPLGRISLLNAEDRRRMLMDWNQTAIDYRSDIGLHHRFEEQAAATPHATALICGARRLTYRELNQRSDEWARHLVHLGAGPGDAIGLFLPRGEALVIALLAILKTGAAYVPMDPKYPADRVGFMLEDSGARLVVTDREHQPNLPTRGPRAVCWDDGCRPSHLPLPRVGGGELAYIIYTSGSTGRPKGVALEHRNAVAFLAWAHTVFSPRELDGVLAATSICFDLSIFELFAPLTCGGKVILAENVLALPTLPAAHEIRLLNTVPSAIAELLRLDGLPSSIETVNLAGEPLPQAIVDQLYSRPGIRRVYDLYGPTETTTYSTFALRLAGGRSTIGRPIGNTQIYLLDGQREPVPVGVPGELHIGGAGVARGYLNRPELTAERFIPDPFSAQPGARLYRTGDLCRYRSDGALEYLGRLDHQVKIRGFRIELGEIETALMRHPDVSEAVVVARDDAGAGRRLVAYIVAKGPATDIGRLRTFLRATLPDQMIPSAFAVLATLPRTPNGKVDRARLPAAGPHLCASPSDYVAPRDELEARLARVWESVLRVSPIGVNERFFDLGGHSLLAVRLTAEIEKALERKLPVAAIFQAPTVGELAGLLRQRVQADRPEALIAIQPEGARPPLYLVHGMGGGGLWGYANLARGLGEDQPVYAFKALEPDDPEHPATIEEMAARYVAEMQRRQPRGPYRLGGYCFGGNVAYEMARQLEAKGETVEVLALLSAWPANHGHDRLSWKPLPLARFVQNFARRALRFLRWDARARRDFFRWKFEQAKKRLARRLGRGPARQSEAVHRLVDLSTVPVAERILWHAHMQALMRYRPGNFGGEVTLLRTRSYPVICSFEPQHGWDRLAARVTVREIPGWHETLMSPPDVNGVAAVLKESLARSPAPR